MPPASAQGLVEAFVAQGARVAFCDIADDAAAELVARLQGDAVHPPLYRRCDLTDVEAVRALVAETEAALGGIDVLVNNAGNDDRHSDRRGDAGLLGRAHGGEPAPPVLRRAGGGAGHDGGPAAG